MFGQCGLEVRVAVWTLLRGLVEKLVDNYSKLLSHCNYRMTGKGLMQQPLATSPDISHSYKTYGVFGSVIETK
jgi:hypothetical protein